MPKHKLSPVQRTAIRKIIQRQVSRKTPQAEILRSVAKTYSISTEAARWYLKSLGKPNGRSKKARATRQTKRPGRKRVRSRAASGNGLRLLDAVKGFSRDQLRRALVAKELVPKLEASRRRQKDLKEVQQRVSKELRSVERQARQLERRIGTLTRS